MNIIMDRGVLEAEKEEIMVTSFQGFKILFLLFLFNIIEDYMASKKCAYGRFTMRFMSM